MFLQHKGHGNYVTDRALHKNMLSGKSALPIVQKNSSPFVDCYFPLD